MTALVLDAGAFIAVDRGNRQVVALLAAARHAGLPLRTNANVVAQVWRDDRGRQVNLGRFLRSVDVRAVDETMGRAAGVLLSATGGRDAVDATVVLLAEAGDQIMTGDRSDLAPLVQSLGRRVEIIDC